MANSGWPPSCRNKIPWLFTDFSLTKFSFSLTKILQFYNPICLLTADKWQSPFTISLKSTSLILQMKQIESLNSFLAQNVLKLTSFHSLKRAEREKKSILLKINTFFTFQVVKIPATTHILGQNYEIPWLSWYLKFPWPICKIPWLFPDFEEKSNFPDFSLTSGHPVIHCAKEPFTIITRFEQYSLI